MRLFFRHTPTFRTALLRGCALVLTAAGTAVAQTYSYDAGGRLVRAVYPDGKGVSYQYDAADNIVSVLPIEVPAAPGNVSATVAGNGAVQLSWFDQAQTENGYVVQRRLADNYAWQTVATLGANATGFTDQSLNPNLTYVYRIQASGTSGGSAFSALHSTQAQLLASWLANISNRALVGTGADILIPGFVISGSTPKNVLVRAVGPTLGLPPFHVPGALADPRLTVFNASGAVLTTNDDWGAGADPNGLRDAFARTGAFPLPDGSKDAAVLVTLPPGAYTVHASGVNDSTGVAIVEVYDADFGGAGSRLVNISGRARVGVGADILIPGFVVDGVGNKRFLLRGVGPTIGAAPFNVPGALANPKLTLFRGTEVQTENDNWGDSSNPAEIAATAAAIGAFPLASGSADAAILIDLAPGAYTLHLSGVGDTSGVALIEIYEVP